MRAERDRRTSRTLAARANPCLHTSTTHVDRSLGLLISFAASRFVNVCHGSGGRRNSAKIVERIYGNSLVQSQHLAPLASWYRRGGKRCLDLVLGLTLLVMVLPLLAVAAVLIKLESRGPVLFIQERLGRGGRLFPVWKLRTMTDRPRHIHRQVFDGDAEVTRVGNWLRRTKIDELPQLWNVIRGEMSVVGPRPGLAEHRPQLDHNGQRRLEVRPGLTGWAQVHGNIYLSWPHRWCYDAWYVDHQSLALDAWIVIRTVAVVVCGEEKFARRSSSRRAA